ncbi:glycosyltransferase family 2 protein [Salinibacter grassmerensis]|uniref:glycosyltransferase family 2 protein n=1 Tax=Salinibacter grassmerensis TaxID=3040353 RepID=UPI0021E9296F|nr:glycosyltransferase family A protein [Salinibacter grassmerensis]
MESPLVSICMPAYNAEDYVADAIDSALAQTWSPLEIVVVNDGSTDCTGEILDAYDFECDRLRVSHQENQGQCAAANDAYRAAHGDLIKFFDADDLLSPDFVERQVEQLDGSTTHVASAEWARFYDDPSESTFEPEDVWRDMDPVDWLVTAWGDARPMMQCALWLIPRPVLEEAGLWDERLSLINDFEFFTRVLVHAEGVRFTPGARMYYRSGLDESLSGQDSREHVESAFRSLMDGTQHLLDREDSPRTRRAAANMLRNFVYEYYPDYSNLRAKIEARVEELGGSDLEPQGPPGFELLRPILGWKLARRVQHFAERNKLTRAGLSSHLESYGLGSA